MHLKLFAGNDDWWGLSPIVVAASIIDQMNAGNDWNTALVQNAARPSGALVMQGMMTEEQIRRLRKQTAERYGSGKNAGKPIILDGGMQWIPFGLSPIELDWLLGKQENAKELAVALAIPPEM